MPGGERLACLDPLGGDAFNAGVAGDDSTDDGAGGITVAEAIDSRPDGLFKVIEVVPGAPQRKGDGVLGRDTAAVAEDGDRRFYRRILWDPRGVAQTFFDCALRDVSGLNGDC